MPSGDLARWSFQAESLVHTSPGQNPGNTGRVLFPRRPTACLTRMNRAFSAPEGFGVRVPRALPWAGMKDAFGLATGVSPEPRQCHEETTLPPTTPDPTQAAPRGRGQGGGRMRLAAGLVGGDGGRCAAQGHQGGHQPRALMAGVGHQLRPGIQFLSDYRLDGGNGLASHERPDRERESADGWPAAVLPAEDQ